ncbi:MAG: DEAD/DEAH box helicase, partial [Bifidobacteriaceae bacterium]|nr:DEAD/DEAH box helicase [Bifidobacteriaceae bacterium]
PTFNMAVNLLHASDYKTARDTLDHSFAQWEVNASAVELKKQIEVLRQTVKNYEKGMKCELGDFVELLKIRMQLSDLQKNERKRLKHRIFANPQERKREYAQLDLKIRALRELEHNHPCKACPDIAQHNMWGHQWTREYKKLNRLEHRYESRTGLVARDFDSICQLLSSLDYLRQDDEHHTYVVTERGELLRRLFNEYDVTLAQTIFSGLLDDIAPVELACIMSALVIEERRGSTGEPRSYPGGADGRVASICRDMRRIHAQINIMREDFELEDLGNINVSMVDTVYSWANGAQLSQILRNSDLTGGDFVRNMKRLSDMLRQLSDVEPFLGDHQHIAHIAKEAEHLINRGVIRYNAV